MKSKIKAKDLLKLPEREWDKKSIYSTICVVNSRKKHSSGYTIMAIVGMKNLQPIEIAGYCDDINWKIDTSEDFKMRPNLRTDMFYPSGIVHFHQNGCSFEVGISLSSMDIKVIKNQ